MANTPAAVTSNSRILEYHRPNSIEAALSLLEADGAAALGGGTVLSHQQGPRTVVDLQALGLDQITATDTHTTAGAMVRLQDLIESPETPALVAEAAGREGPNTLRNAATVGGVVACGDWESELLAALLAHDATVTMQRSTGSEEVTLEDAFTGRDARTLITKVRIATGGEGASARTGRTPADESIVSVYGRRDAAGNTRLAMSGVAAVPVLVDHDQVNDLDPPGDFRGSPGYRRELARILGRRVLDEIG